MALVHPIQVQVQVQVQILSLSHTINPVPVVPHYIIRSVGRLTAVRIQRPSQERNHINHRPFQAPLECSEPALQLEAEGDLVRRLCVLSSGRVGGFWGSQYTHAQLETYRHTAMTPRRSLLTHAWHVESGAGGWRPFGFVEGAVKECVRGRAVSCR